MRYFTFKKNALAAKASWQVLRFTEGLGYWLFGTRPKLAPITMYDSVDVSQIPLNAQAVAGYTNGRYKNFDLLALQFSNAKALSIDVLGTSVTADCLDVEKGDASIPTAVRWVENQLATGARRPVVYTSVSNAPGLLKALAIAGIARTQIRLWTAHYTFVPHRCSSACGFGFTGQADATQYSDHGFGRNLDVSLCSPTFFE